MVLRWMRLALVMAGMLTWASSGVAAENAPEKVRKVAVLPFDVAKGSDPQLGKTLAGALLGEVRKARGRDVDVMASDDVVQALPGPLRGRLKRCEMAACKAQMAQAVNADRALGGSISTLGSTVVLNLTLLEASDGSQVTQWTGKAPANKVEELLDQLPAAVATLFPPPAGAAPVVATAAPAAPGPTVPGPTVPVPTPLAGPVAPPPGPAANPLPLPPMPADVKPAPAPGPAGSLPPPVAAPILPQDETPPPMVRPAPTGEQMMATMTDPQGAYPSVKAQDAEKPRVEPPSWNKGLLGAGVGLIVPGVLLGVLAVAAAVGSTVGSIAAAIAARNINAEIKAVPHKETGGYPLSALILTGRLLEVGGYAGLGAAAVIVLVGLIAVSGFVLAGIGLMVAAYPRGADQSTFLGERVSE
jgi:hypothetical protein